MVNLILFAFAYLFVLGLIYLWYYYASQNSSRLSSAEKEFLSSNTKFALDLERRRFGIPPSENQTPEEPQNDALQAFVPPWWYTPAYLALLAITLGIVVVPILWYIPNATKIVLFLSHFHSQKLDGIFLPAVWVMSLTTFPALIGLYLAVIMIPLQLFGSHSNPSDFDAWSNIIAKKSMRLTQARREKIRSKIIVSINEIEREKRNLKENSYLKPTLLLVIILLIVSFPFSVLAFDTYNRFSSDGFYNNRFWSLHEHFYEWGSIKDVTFGFETLQDTNNTRVEFYLTINPNNGAPTRLRDDNEIRTNVSDVDALVKLIQSRSVSLHYLEPTAKQRAAMRPGGTYENIDHILTQATP